MATVETRALFKRFDGVAAVDGIDLPVREGEFLVLLGPSGCGKTTLLRMIAGLETPSSGDVLIDGRVVTPLPPRERNMAMVFQSYALYPHLTVADNIAFPLRAHGMRGAEAAERVQRAAAMFSIERLLKRKPRQLSGGERQRVALARAVVREPVVFLLDEPLSNLDAQLRSTARDELQHFQRRLGTTTIYVTHDQIEAMGLGDRIAVLDHGRIHHLGTPREIYVDPADTFVATFIGSPPMNLVETDDIITGFRPEQFMPVEARPKDEPMRRFTLDVGRVEYLGADRLVYGTLAPPLPPSRVIARLPAGPELPVSAGERHEFAVRERDLRHFDRASGRRVS
ncbi:ABC transporter ATP-binding protein [Azoarcus sp. DN11]|uniref:ABC transporter ATP-binding protein n=1 Tax=Azoarcus sp. DN11 TaxID=356837 RepID=UPI000EAF000A|nr:ABC transporter ATP-binding protein [Azoarcus sp. DN11]AYH44027.1 ABC transporter [Azoarcus sp. DN11]